MSPELYVTLVPPARSEYVWSPAHLPTCANYVDNNSAPTIASNLLEANAVLSWSASYQRAKRYGPLLYATIGYTPACYARQFLLSATHMQQGGERAHVHERP